MDNIYTSQWVGDALSLASLFCCTGCQDDTADHISSEVEVVIRQHDMRDIFCVIVLISNVSLEKILSDGHLQKTPSEKYNLYNRHVMHVIVTNAD